MEIQARDGARPKRGAGSFLVTLFVIAIVVLLAFPDSFSPDALLWVGGAAIILGVFWAMAASQPTAARDKADSIGKTSAAAPLRVGDGQRKVLLGIVIVAICGLAVWDSKHEFRLLLALNTLFIWSNWWIAIPIAIIAFAAGFLVENKFLSTSFRTISGIAIFFIAVNIARSLGALITWQRF